MRINKNQRQAMHKAAIVIGAGIVGLATARALAIKGYKVTVLERTDRAVGASIRNFGMIWPVGQPSGMLYERAILSKDCWKTVCKEAGIWYDEVGSLHVAHHQLEQDVLEEFYESIKEERPCCLLSAAETIKMSPAVVTANLKGALFSEDEMIVDPREAMTKIPIYLAKKYGVQFIWSSGVTKIFHPAVLCGKKVYEADEIFICNGADFETLFPEQFAALPITKCKLQMMRMEAQANDWRMGPALCGGLSLLHYKSFAMAASLPALQKKFQNEMPDYLTWGIHVMAAQNESGQLTIGDSHEYGNSFEPFDRMFINDMILSYLHSFASFKNTRITETWNGIYAKLTTGETEVVTEPQKGVWVINGLSGAGMTMAFGLCQQIINGDYQSQRTMKKILASE